MWFLAIIGGALVVAVFRVTTRYEYGPKSRRWLTAEVAGSLVVGLALSRWAFFPTTTGIYFILASLAVAVVVFILSALATAEILRKGRQRTFDEHLAALRVRQETLSSELDRVNRQTQAEFRRDEEADRGVRERESRIASDRKKIETWKRAGGAARIRSLKLEEWEQELRVLGPAELAARRETLEAELAQAPDAERRAQIEVLLALVNIIAISGPAKTSPTIAVGGDVPEPGGPDPAASNLCRLRRETEAELAQVRSELADWQRRLADFLSKEIVLD